MKQARASSQTPQLPVIHRREIEIANRHPCLRLNRAEVRRLFATLERHELEITRGAKAMPAGVLSLVFLTDAALAKLHAEFLDDPSSTDVITFVGHPLLGTAGEICVSAETAASYARAHDHDFSTELALYLVHGWLHLAGFDDLAPAKKRAMRRAEARAMRVLAATDGVPTFEFRASAKKQRFR